MSGGGDLPPASRPCDISPGVTQDTGFFSLPPTAQPLLQFSLSCRVHFEKFASVKIACRDNLSMWLKRSPMRLAKPLSGGSGSSSKTGGCHSFVYLIAYSSALPPQFLELDGADH